MQCSFFEWLAYSHPVARKTSFAIPNGAKRSLQDGARQKRSGLAAGCPDVMIAVPSGECPGLFIEFKIKPNKPSQAQIEMIANLKEQGYSCYVVYTLDEAVKITSEYLNS